MAISNRTKDFSEVVRQKKGDNPRARPRPRRTTSSSNDDEAQFGKNYMSEAYKIVSGQGELNGDPDVDVDQLNHITDLTKMLSAIRKPYLNVDSRPLHFGSTSRTLDLSGGAKSWADVKQLSNQERDEIDLQARVILSRCADRVKEMEALEKRRVEILASKTNPLTRFLPARLRQDDASLTNKSVAAHHASVTWYLNRRLAEASQAQKEMQEERVKRQLERSRTLGSGATFEAQNFSTTDRRSQTSSGGGSGSWLGDASSSIIAATIGAPSPSDNYTSTQPSFSELDIPSDDDDDDLELSASQIQQFETENANLLRNVQDKLEAVQQAESRLLEISALQAELITHLTAQTELSDQLYEDAIATTSTVEKGNEQLREAKRRTKDSRLFILVFLIGASVSLLFLHYY
ncbi:hypothetical protein V5O48_011205 [Marasmius crinis-equi]|uniref:t-SNARE coiled-coil homology domain-containing protein n=1 Tax=Marasmius crinis-equi TaxID=585013 RepID=A0ABR3F6A3_9AGAR